MYNSNYEEYMRNVLGYNPIPQNTYQMSDSMYESFNLRNYEDATLEALYPDIYRIVYPMIQKACMKIGNVINKDIIEKITDEIFRAMEEGEKREDTTNKRISEVKSTNIQQTRKIEEPRQRNYMLRDLIKILILRELLGRQGNGRPPMRTL